MDKAISFALQYERPEARRLALATVLSRKGRVLDSTSDPFATVRRHLGPDEQKLLDEYRTNRAIYARQLLRGPGRIPEDQHRKNLAALQQRGNELERLIAARSKEFRGQLRPVTPEAVQAVLPEGAVLVEWVRYRAFDSRAPRKEAFGADRYAASILGRTGEPAWIDLGEARPIDAAIAAWRSALARQLATTNQLGRELDALVMAPVRARLGDANNIFLAPDGPLHLVPFAALVDEQGRHLAGANACQSPATSGADSDDGLLTALEAASLNFHGTELAVLSACDTGIGATELRDEFLDRDIGRGEGVYGLRRALVLAGTRTQMVSLWRVDDAVTRQLMAMYYRKLAGGAGRAEALRQVQLELLGSNDLSLPYYWASFIVSGDPSPLPQKVTATIPTVQRAPGAPRAGPGPPDASAALSATTRPARRAVPTGTFARRIDLIRTG